MFCDSPLEFIDTLYQNRIYIKREDKLPFSFGGNKVRFAEAFLCDMLAQGKNAMIAYGSKSSNLCRVIAQLCADNEIPCAVVYSEGEDTQTNNSRIVSSLGVREYACDKSSVAKTVETAINDLTDEGYNPYYIYGSTLGKGNELTPVRSYTKVYDEILAYESKNGVAFEYIFIATGTAASYSGLICKAAELNDTRAIIGISVARPKERCCDIIKDNLSLYLKRDIKASIKITDKYLFGGYGMTSKEEIAEIDFIYDNYGIPLDPTYTGKAFFGMKAYLTENNIKDKNILFIHTGGYPLFCDYKNMTLTGE